MKMSEFISLTADFPDDIDLVIDANGTSLEIDKITKMAYTVFITGTKTPFEKSHDLGVFENDIERIK
jgi:hypothetical protein